MTTIPLSPTTAAKASSLDLAREVLRIEAQEVEALAARLDVRFSQAVEMILQSRGRVVVTGMGKSGHVGRKIAATLASTGTPAFFMHPAEASHGDLGMITAEDVVLALSNSGESGELLAIMPQIKRMGAKLISMTGNQDSELARESDVHLDASVSQEACPLGLAPTASTTAALALGDALAVALLDARGFSAEDFARAHPGGALGRRLLVHVEDVMRSGEQVPKVSASQALSEGLLEMSRKGLGMTAIVDANHRPIGIFTDGDLRRTFAQGVDVATTRMDQVMHAQPLTIAPNRLAVEAVELMESRKINGLLVVDEQGVLVGALNMHDLLKAKVV
jgi:arabinose-5-phosphate isomerase